MQFPDLAGFPEYVNEKRNEKPVDLTPFYNAFANGNWNDFVTHLVKYTDINAAWVQKLAQNFKIYSDIYIQGARQSNTLPNNDCWQCLYRNGLYITQLDISDFDYSAIIEQQLKRPDWQPEPGTYDRGTFLGDIDIEKINRLFTNAGILDAVSAYSAKIRKVTNAYLHISTPTDYNYKQFMSDATLEPKWINTHIDPKEDVMKAIIYLEDVGEDNGGFGYVSKSNRFVYDELQNIFGRAISTGNYCRTPEMRKSIFSLPQQLRVSFNFGRCVLDDSTLAQDLDQNFIRVTSNMGNVMVFDAGAGIHQGGKCETGRRIAIQVLMK